jgi:hypothetical protein
MVIGVYLLSKYRFLLEIERRDIKSSVPILLNVTFRITITLPRDLF